MRLSAIFPLLCSLAALILTLLCLFAGTTKSFLPNADLLTLNASRLGHTTLFNTTDGDGGFFSNLLNNIEGDLDNLINNATSDIADDLNLHDFYSAHIMTYCEGFYEDNGNTTDSHAKENITYCSNRTALFHFDPTAIIENELAPGVNLSDLHWPQGIEDGIRAVELASKVMFVFYVIGITFAGFAILSAVWGVFANGRMSAFVNWVLDVLAFLTIGIASAIATIIIVKAVHVINKYGNEIGIAAYKGKEFLAMTWAATAIMLLASLMWIAECCAGRRRNKRGFGEKPAY
jgi:hypothetical protein